MSTTLYWKSTCTTCREVRSALLARKPSGMNEKNYSKTPLTIEETRAIVSAAGVPAALNLTHALAKERGWRKSPPGVEELAQAAVADPNLLRRPILLVDDGGAVRAWVHRDCLNAPV